jgi:hypothetical protein
MAIVTVGWLEKVVLPNLGRNSFITKIDTGAYRSALHAQNIVVNGRKVRFQLSDGSQYELRLIGECLVTSSCGHTEKRPIVRTAVRIGTYEFKTQFTLTNRSGHRAEILLGRKSVSERFIVDPKRRFVLS